MDVFYSILQTALTGSYIRGLYTQEKIGCFRNNKSTFDAYEVVMELKEKYLVSELPLRWKPAVCLVTIYMLLKLLGLLCAFVCICTVHVVRSLNC